MVDFDVREVGDWIVDGELGHEIWTRIKNSPRVRFTDGIAILAKLVEFGDDTNLVRLAGEEVEGPDDWAEPFGLLKPELRMAFRFSTKLKTENPREVKMAIYARTNNGANFVHEFTQERGEDAVALIRVPVPDELREEALELSKGFEGCDMVREQAGAFQERFNITDETPPMSYWEPHIECNRAKSKEEILNVFDDVLDIVERGVRISS